MTITTPAIFIHFKSLLAYERCPQYTSIFLENLQTFAFLFASIIVLSSAVILPKAAARSYEGLFRHTALAPQRIYSKASALSKTPQFNRLISGFRHWRKSMDIGPVKSLMY